MCNHVNPKTVPEKILIAFDREWDEEYILNYVKKYDSNEIAKEILKVYDRVMSK